MVVVPCWTGEVSSELVDIDCVARDAKKKKYIYIYMLSGPPQALHFGINLLRISTDSKSNNHQHH